MKFFQEKAWGKINQGANVSFNIIYDKGKRIENKILNKSAGLVEVVEIGQLYDIFLGSFENLSHRNNLSELELSDLGKIQRFVELLNSTKILVKEKNFDKFNQTEWSWFLKEILETAQSRKDSKQRDIL